LIIYKGIGSVWSAKVVTFGDADFNQINWLINSSFPHWPRRIIIGIDITTDYVTIFRSIVTDVFASLQP
jgi:hypothetical protein